MLLRVGIVLGLGLTGAVLAYEVVERLSDEALLTLVGLACGVAAGVPVTLGLLAALLRERRREPEAPVWRDDGISVVSPEGEFIERTRPSGMPPLEAGWRSGYPPVVVWTPPAGHMLAGYGGYNPYGVAAPPGVPPLLPPPIERDFKIVGDEEVN